MLRDLCVVLLLCAIITLQQVAFLWLIIKGRTMIYRLFSYLKLAKPDEPYKYTRFDHYTGAIASIVNGAFFLWVAGASSHHYLDPQVSGDHRVVGLVFVAYWVVSGIGFVWFGLRFLGKLRATASKGDGSKKQDSQEK